MLCALLSTLGKFPISPLDALGAELLRRSNGNVAVLPIVPDSGSKAFMDEEYLQLYPKIDLTDVELETPTIWISQSQALEKGSFKRFSAWIDGSDKLRAST